MRFSIQGGFAMKRILALLLALVMVFGCMPVFAGAEETASDAVDEVPAPTTPSYELRFTGPNKLVYLQNKEDLDLTGVQILYNGSDGTAVEVDLGTVTVTGFDNTKQGEQYINLDYTHPIDGNPTNVMFSITIVEKSTLQEMWLSQVPDKTEYTLGEALDLTGGILVLQYDTHREEIPLTDKNVTVKGYDPSLIGPQALTVTVSGVVGEACLDVLVKAPPRPRYIEFAEGKAPKDCYMVGESLDLSLIVLDVHYSDGTSKQVNADDPDVTVTGFDSSKPRRLEIKFEYGGGNRIYQSWVSQTQGKCGDNLNFSYDETSGTLTITGTGAMYDFHPWGPSENDPAANPVSPWGGYADEIKKVVLPSGITTIGSYAFSNCYSLETVNLPGSLTTLNEFAFCNCFVLLLAKDALPASVKTIGQYAFSDCYGITEFDIPQGVTIIDDYAFAYCTNLAKINLPSSVKVIGNGAFIACPALTAIDLPEGLQAIRSVAFQGSGLTEFTIPGTVTEIAYQAFYDTANLKEVTFEGDAPTIQRMGDLPANIFSGWDYPADKAMNAYYPGGNDTWTDKAREEFSDHDVDFSSPNITWIPSYGVTDNDTGMEPEVDGLDKVAEDLDELLQGLPDYDPNQKNTVALVISNVAIDTSDEEVRKAIDEIEKVGEEKCIDYMDITLSHLENGEVVVHEGNTNLGSKNNHLLVITLRYDNLGKKNMVVFRYHNGKVDTLTQNPNADGEFIEVKDGTLVIHAKKFSTYGVGYDAIPVVRFQTDGGSTVASLELDAGSKITKPADPTKDGYVFRGWYQDEALTDPWDFAADTVDKDITLYAKWEEVSCETGCTLGTGHEGDCFVPCSLSGICTLTNGHTGSCAEGSLYFNPYGFPDVMLPSHSIELGATDHMDICFSADGTYQKRISVPLDQLTVTPAAGLSLSYDSSNSSQQSQILLKGTALGEYTISYTHPQSKRVYSVNLLVKPVPDYAFYMNGSRMYVSQFKCPMGGTLNLEIRYKGTPVTYDTITLSPATGMTVRAGSGGNLLFSATDAAQADQVFAIYCQPQGAQAPTKLEPTIKIDGGSQSGSVLLPGMLVAFDNESGQVLGQMFMEPGQPLETSFAIIPNGAEPLVAIDPAQLYATSDLIQIERISATRCKVTMLPGGNGYIRTPGDSYPFHAIANGAGDDFNKDESANLLAYDTRGNLLQSPITLARGEELRVKLRYGGTGASLPVTELHGDSSDPSVVSVTDNQDGTFTLKALDTGKAVISHEDATGDNGLHVTVVSVKAGPENLFITNAPDPFGNTYITYLHMKPNSTFCTTFYFGTSPTDCEAVDVDVKRNSTLSLKKQPDGSYCITSGAAGTELIQYEKDGIDYTLPVLISEENRDSNIQAHNTVTIGSTTYGTALLGQEKMVIEPQFGAYYQDNSTQGFAQSFVLAAMNADGDADASAYDKISDVSFRMLTCIHEDAHDQPSQNASLSSFTAKVPSSTITTWGASVQAKAKQGFHSTVSMSFTLENGTEAPMRITLQTQVSYVKQEGNVEITIADPDPNSNGTGGPLDTAAELNVVLSSYDVFLNWLEDPGEGVSVNGDYKLGGSITINLPATSYTDGLVIAQMITPVDSSSDKTPISHIRLVGNGTTMAGLIHKGGVNLVDGIRFVADPDLTMTIGDESFTCGILGDSGYFDSLNAPLDKAYVDRYCTGTGISDMGCAIELSNLMLDTYPDDLRWSTGTIYNIYNCSFSGYDYGIRTTSNGMVGGGRSCSFDSCYYGIHMDSKGFGVSAGNPHNVDYNNMTFTYNVYPVHLVSLPKDATPYQFRVHDSDFIHNHREFFIEPSGSYYFYRNYYGGYWFKDNTHPNWHNFKNQEINFDSWDKAYQQNQHTGHRPGRYQKVDELSETGAVVVTTGARITYQTAVAADSTSGYWIYDREDQNNHILKSETNLPIDQAAIEALEQDTTITIMDDNAKPIASITFQGKEN